MFSANARLPPPPTSPTFYMLHVLHLRGVVTVISHRLNRIYSPRTVRKTKVYIRMYVEIVENYI